MLCSHVSSSSERLSLPWQWRTIVVTKIKLADGWYFESWADNDG